MTSKIITGSSDNKSYTYDYNLQNRLSCVTTSYTQGSDDINDVTEYTYNDEGIRVKSYHYQTVNGGNPQNEETKTFLIDAYNHTGYAQVLEEWTLGGSVPDVTYTIGDDIISQAKTGTPDYLLYDGHGSTRQLASSTGGIVEAFSYDGYGVLLGGNPTSASPPQTNLLYTGEYLDTDAQQYYLRARWYDALNGRFNQLDPYAGNNSDPQSLHKYLYCHANPVNAIDPSGLQSIAEINVAMFIGMLIVGLLASTVLNPPWRRAAEKTLEDVIKVTIALVAFGMMPFKDGWRWIKDQWERLKNQFKDREGLYLHYGYRKDWVSFLTFGLLHNKYATRDIYLDGWFAKWFLALPGPPRNAVYVIWPKKGFGPTGQSFVPPGYGMPGGGYQYYFLRGSGGAGTAFPPIPIPEGSGPTSLGPPLGP